MQRLSVNRINAVSPYEVWAENDRYSFATDFGVRIDVSFDADESLLATATAYWFNIVNLNGKPSPRDRKVMPTVWSIIEEFFRVNPQVLMYLCDTVNNQQAMRARLFHHWFMSYKGHDRFIFKQSEIPDEDIINYVVMIVKGDNPLAAQICDEFDEQTNIFRNGK